MNLHRADTKPDWHAVPALQRNVWQRQAARTHGIITPGNIVSLAGAALVGVGLWYVAAGRLGAGLAVMGIGRLLDIVDGTLADKTGTKSPLGESVDATLDKTGAFAALIVFTATGILPLPFALLIGIENGITSLVGLLGKSLKRTIHPERAGKIGGALEWVALLGFVLGVAIHAGIAPMFTVAASVVAAISVTLNGYATVRYIQTFHAQRSRSR